MEDFFINLFNPENRIYQLLIAVFLGAFIGLRRELFLQKNKTEGLMGLRTVSLLVLLGTISTFFPQIHLLPLFAFLGVSIYILIAYINGVFNLNKIGLTTEITILIMFLVGVLIGNAQIFLAILVTIIIGVFNAYKSQFHNFAKKISLKEWTGGMQLLVISLVVLPLLPTTAIDPWGVIIPFNIWLFVVLISGISFIGYFLNKYMGERKSIQLTSILGSFVSSTVVTTSLAIKSKKEPKTSSDFFVAIVLLSMIVMEVRVMIGVLILSRGFYWEFILALFLMLITTILLFLFLFFKNKNKKEETKSLSINPNIKSPFEIVPALKFATIFTIILILIYFAKNFFSDYGVYLVTFLSSFVDSDAPVLSILESFNNGGVSKEVAWKVITMVVLVNTFSKLIYIYIFGRRDFFKKIVFYFSLILLSGFSIFLIL